MELILNYTEQSYYAIDNTYECKMRVCVHFNTC